MKRKNTAKRIGAIIAAFVISTCSCFTVTAGAENDSRNLCDDQKVFVYVENSTRSSDFVRNIVYNAESTYYRCKATFKRNCSGTMYVTLKKQASSGSWYTYASCSDTFSSKSFCNIREDIILTSGTYKIYVDIYTDTSSYSSSCPDIIIA